MTRILVSQSSLFSIAGSEVVTYELSQQLSLAGHEVLVFTYGIGDQWEALFAELSGLRVLRQDDAKADAVVEEFAPEVAWIHHQLVPMTLARSPRDTRFVFHHMSSFLPQEFPVFPAVERALASRVLFAAEETQLAQLESGLLNGIESDRLGVFGNPAPDAFFRPSPERPHSSRVLVVSNHPPRELLDAFDILGGTVEVVYFGEVEGKETIKRVMQPSDFDGVAAVVTIGKTVQYAIVHGLPVYCYDHFGGPGWLDDEVFEKARVKNFSGRGFSKKTAEDIAEDISSGLGSAFADALVLHEQHARRFLLSTALDEVLAELREPPHYGLEPVALESFRAYQEITNGSVNAIAARDQTARFLSGKVTLLEEQLRQTASYAEGLERAVAEYSDRADERVDEIAALVGMLEDRTVAHAEALSRAKARSGYLRDELERVRKELRRTRSELESESVKAGHLSSRFGSRLTRGVRRLFRLRG